MAQVFPATVEFTPHAEHRELYRVGKFVFTVEGNNVVLTKDTPRGIQSFAIYTYHSHEEAAEAAWKMANKEARR